MISAVITFEDDKVSIHTSKAKNVDSKFQSGFYKAQYDSNGNLRIKKESFSELHEPFISDANSKVIETVQAFFKPEVKEKVNKLGFTHKLGILLHGIAGCLGKGTKVLMFDGTHKKVEDIQVGDVLMGPDSTPRNVLELYRGKEQMYWVHQNKGISYRVNESHILSLVKKTSNIYSKPTVNGVRKIDKTKLLKEGSESIFNVSVKNCVKNNYQNSKIFKGYVHSSIEYPLKPFELSVCPYFLGIWLSDGSKRSTVIHTPDKEIETYIKNYSELLNLKFVKRKKGNKCPSLSIVKKEGLENELLTKLRNLNVLNNKHIPLNYLTSSIENRKLLLAGLIDGDGYHGGKGYYEITQKREKLAENIAQLSRSLGFKTRLKKVFKKATNSNHEGDLYYRITFNCETVLPTLIPRKTWDGVKSNFKNRLHTGFSLEKDTVDNYYGFELDGDHLFILEDGTVTHNTGKTSTLNYIADKMIEHHNAIVFTCNNGDTLTGAISLGQMIREVQDNPILFIADEFERYAERNESEMKNFLDGNDSIENSLFMAATNYIDKVPDTLKDRPSRFRVVEEVKGIEDKKVMRQVLHSISEKIQPNLFTEEELNTIVEDLDSSTIDQLKHICLDQVTNTLLNIEPKTTSIGFKKEDAKSTLPSKKRNGIMELLKEGYIWKVEKPTSDGSNI